MNDQYISRLNTLISTLLCNHTHVKYLLDDDQSRLIACPLQVILEYDVEQPFYSIIASHLESFHQRFEGCSCKTFLFFVTTLNELLRSTVSSMEILRALEQIIDESIVIARERFRQRLFPNQHFHQQVDYTRDILRRLCRDQPIYAEGLFQAFSHCVSAERRPSLAQLIDYFEHLQHITIVRHGLEQCSFVDGIVLRASDGPVAKGYRRSVLLDGCLLENYTHLGYASRVRLKEIADPSKSSSSWVDVITSIIEQFRIEVILCSGSIDAQLKERHQSSIVLIDRLPSKTLRALQPDDKSCILNYLTDINEEEHILRLKFIESDFLTVESVDRGTIVHCVPFERLIEVQHERFVHCLARFCHILRLNSFVLGSGEFEQTIIDFWSVERTQRTDFSMQFAFDCFLECLQRFLKHIHSSQVCFEANLIDDFDSKVQAWKASVNLLKIILQIDQIVENNF